MGIIPDTQQFISLASLPHTHTHVCQIVPVCSLFSSNSSQLCSKCITLSLPCCRSRLACKSSRSLKFRRGWVFGCFASVLFPNTQSIRDRKRSPSCRSLVEFKQPQQSPPLFYFFLFCDLSTGPVLGVNIALLAWNPPLQGQSSINKLSGPEGVHACACVCVWVCVSLLSCDWSHEYGGAPGFVQSLTRSIKPEMRAAEWERRRGPGPARFQPWTSTLSAEAKTSAGGGEVMLAGGRGGSDRGGQTPDWFL